MHPLFMLAWVLALSGAQPARSCSNTPLVANIGHALSASPASWATTSERTVSKNQTVYFHAMNYAGTAPLTSDVDWDNGNADDADYDWDFCWQTDWDVQDSRTASVSYSTPGDRIVHLRADDTGPPNYINEGPICDDLKIAVTMTVETDWMPNRGLINMDTFQNYWPAAGYSSVVINPNHDSSCDYYQYLYDEMQTDAALLSYLDGYENQSCDAYLIGIDLWSQHPDWATTTSVSVNNTYSCIFRGKGAGVNTSRHEVACHDATLNPPSGYGHHDPAIGIYLCVRQLNISDSAFCSGCAQQMKAHIISLGP